MIIDLKLFIPQKNLAFLRYHVLGVNHSDGNDRGHHDDFGQLLPANSPDKPTQGRERPWAFAPQVMVGKI